MKPSNPRSKLKIARRNAWSHHHLQPPRAPLPIQRACSKHAVSAGRPRHASMCSAVDGTRAHLRRDELLDLDVDPCLQGVGFPNCVNEGYCRGIRFLPVHKNHHAPTPPRLSTIRRFPGGEREARLGPHARVPAHRVHRGTRASGVSQPVPPAVRDRAASRPRILHPSPRAAWTSAEAMCTQAPTSSTLVAWPWNTVGRPLPAHPARSSRTPLPSGARNLAH